MIKIATLVLIFTDLLLGYLPLQAQAPAPKKKIYCNPLVLGQAPTKRLSLQYEYQTGFDAPTRFVSSNLPVAPVSRINHAQSIRLNYSKNLLMKPKAYMSLQAGYWYSTFSVGNPGNNGFARLLEERRFHSFTVSSNLFRPLNATNFLLLNLSLEASGNGESLQNFSGDNLLAGGAIIYGWKKGLKRMWGIGAFRGYRLGRVIHVPALLYNASFNKKWGVDALLPARGQFRYTASPKTMWTMGYDLDGTQFALRSANPVFNQAFFQRGEIRPRIGLEKQLNKYWAFTAQAGVRINGRFDVSSDYAGKKQIVESNPETALFVNAGIHLLNFPKKKKS